MQDVESGVPKYLAASGAVSLVAGNLLGFYVNFANDGTLGGTVVIRNGGATGTAVTGTITPAVGWNRYPAYCPAGCFATITAPLEATFVFAAG